MRNIQYNNQSCQIHTVKNTCTPNTYDNPTPAIVPSSLGQYQSRHLEATDKCHLYRKTNGYNLINHENQKGNNGRRTPGPASCSSSQVNRFLNSQSNFPVPNISLLFPGKCSSSFFLSFPRNNKWLVISQNGSPPSSRLSSIDRPCSGLEQIFSESSNRTDGIKWVYKDVKPQKGGSGLHQSIPR